MKQAIVGSDERQQGRPVARRLAAGALLSALLLTLAACTPGNTAQSWPDETVRSATQAFVDGYNLRDLQTFDSFFASPAQLADPASLASTRDAAHQALTQAQPGSSIRLLSLTVTPPQPPNPQALASIHYRARFAVATGENVVDTVTVEQTVQLDHLGDKWLIIGGDQPQISKSSGAAVLPPGTAVPTDSAPATGAAVEMLANSLHVAPTQIKVVSREALAWPDNCLGVVRVQAACQPGTTPGFRIILEAGGQQYEYHTDASGLRVMPGREGPVVAGVVAAAAAGDQMAGALGIAPDEVRVVSTTLVEWPDDCLGVATPERQCQGGPTPGYRIVLQAQGQTTEYHTNADATIVVPAATP
ncbi:MAG: hypothetical protein R2844_00145 [Caldilineales bacterium]